MRAYSPYAQHGILPAPGGLLDQAAAFLTACAVADDERAKVEETLLERARSGPSSTRSRPLVLGPDGRPAARRRPAPRPDALPDGSHVE